MKKIALFLIVFLAINVASAKQNTPSCNDKNFIKLYQDTLKNESATICNDKSDKESCNIGYSDELNEHESVIIRLKNSLDIDSITTLALDSTRKTLVCRVTLGVDAGGICDGYIPGVDVPYVITNYDSKDALLVFYGGIYVERAPLLPKDFDFEKECGY